MGKAGEALPPQGKDLSLEKRGEPMSRGQLRQCKLPTPCVTQDHPYFETKSRTAIPEGHGFGDGRYKTFIRDDECRQQNERRACFTPDAISSCVQATKSTEFGKVYTRSFGV